MKFGQYKILIFFFSILIFNSIYFEVSAIKKSIVYVDSFKNSHHPNMSYWMFSPQVFASDYCLNTLDSISQNSRFDFIFISARKGANFYDFRTMHSIFLKLVETAHRKGIKIGLQLDEDKHSQVELSNTERVITEYEVPLDTCKKVTVLATQKHVRHDSTIIKTELFKAFAFKKTRNGFYELTSLRDITSFCKTTVVNNGTVSIEITSSPELQGYTAYVIAQHFYNYSSNHSADASQRIIKALQAYSDIPFDGVALDEYTNLRVTPIWELNKKNEIFRERSFSLAMANEFLVKYNKPLDKVLFDMRFAPEGNPEIRIQAINYYMDIMRDGVMHVENAVRNSAKHIFGEKTFVGFHDTHHNSLSGDEVWQTGINWWNLPRDYGHTDEWSPLPTQMGIAKTYPQNVMFNMFYHKKIDSLISKPMRDLKYGIRTNLHGINDFENWGISIEKRQILNQLNQVLKNTELLNKFNPSLPKTNILVIFGMQALLNWYPDELQRGVCDINDKLGIEEKAVEIWNAGYLNALVPSDLIESGKLTLDKDYKPTLNGHTFEAVIFLYPQFSKPSTLLFLSQYVNHGGKLMTEGVATFDFNGRNVIDKWNEISSKTRVNKFDVNKVQELGIKKNILSNGVINEDGSIVFTNPLFLKSSLSATFEFEKNGSNFSGEYKGMVAIGFDKVGSINKISATGLEEIYKNGKIIFKIDKPADVFVEVKSGVSHITILKNESNKKAKIINN